MHSRHRDTGSARRPGGGAALALLLAVLTTVPGRAEGPSAPKTPPATPRRAERQGRLIATWTFEGEEQPWGPAGSGLSLAACPGRRSGKALAVPVRFPDEVATLSMASTGRRAQRNAVARNVPVDVRWDDRNAFFRWDNPHRIRFRVFVPLEARGRVQVSAYVVDGHLRWFQSARLFQPAKGRWNTFHLDISPGSVDWTPLNHSKPWSRAATRQVAEFGFKVFGKEPFAGRVFFDDITITRRLAPAPPLRILNFRVNATTVPRYEKFEITFGLSREYDNPFNPDEIDVSAVFVAEDSGQTTTVPGFYYQQYSRRLEKNREILTPLGRGEWKIRFAPRELGPYRYRITVNDGEKLVTAERRLRCVPSKNPGYVRVSKRDWHYFEFENGDFFYPIGHNIPATYNIKAAEKLGLNVLKHEGTFAYDRFLSGMQRAGENFARIWLASWSFGIEWSRRYDISYRGLGRYNLENAWRLDYVLDQARRRGIYVQLALTTFGHYRSATFEGDWPYSPYNAANGGFLYSPERFWTNTRAREYYHRMLRYIMARWGYSTTIAAWELCNEIDLVTGYRRQRPAIIHWHEDCVEVIRRYDQGPHLVTTNFAVWSRDPDILRLPVIDYSSTNRYETDVPAILQQVFQRKSQHRKPAIVTETGQDFKGSGPETTERYIQICIWSSYMMPFAGSAMQWWWDFIDYRNLYHYFRPLVLYARGEDRRGRNLRIAPAYALQSGGSEILRGIGVCCLKNDEQAYLWVYDRAIVAKELAAPREEHPAVDVLVSGLKPGTYRIEHWNTFTGEVVARAEVPAKGDVLRFPLPPFRSNMAIKIKPAPARPTATKGE